MSVQGQLFGGETEDKIGHENLTGIWQTIFVMDRAELGNDPNLVDAGEIAHVEDDGGQSVLVTFKRIERWKYIQRDSFLDYFCPVTQR